MNEITLDGLKKIELDMLVDIAEFCDKHNLRYYLGGGTLLGAVRHKGFIPWDDDIDINMPRPDYDIFIHKYNGYNKRYYVKAIETDESYWRTFAKVFDSRTYIVEDVIRIDKPGNAVFVDVFPIDGLPDSSIKQKVFFKEQELLNFLYHGSAWNYTRSFKYRDSKSRFSGVKSAVRTLLKFIAITILYPLPTRTLIRIINNNAKKYDFNDSVFIGAIVDCAHGGACEKILKKNYLPRMKFSFEGLKFYGPIGFDEYLTNLYGNYMEMPPENKRVSHHDFKAYWKREE